MIPNAWSPKPQGSFAIFIIQLVRTVDTMSNLFPVNQVLTVENRESRIIHKRRGYHIIIFPNPANRRVWIKPRKQGVFKSMFQHKKFSFPFLLLGLL